MNDASVSSTLGFDVTEPAELVLQIAVATPGTETLTVHCDSTPLEVVELAGRQHYFRAPKGFVSVHYAATVPPVSHSSSASAVTGPSRESAVAGSSRASAVTGSSRESAVADYDRVVALRPSRYCPSDRLAGFAAGQFGSAGDATATVRAICDWVYGHLAYTVGSSGPSTDAIDTMLAGAGVCRDYAHLVATLCRALDIPARVAAVYAPGLSPMDFHLVVETALDGVWRVWDATRLAPRPTLIRIATGRDAADTALATTISGALTMPELRIVAVAGDDLPYDDHSGLVSLP